jgi:hypothetical protein
VKSYSILIWGFGVAIGYAAVLFSIFLTDGDWFSALTYKAHISSLYFVAVSTSAGAAADLFDLALKLKPGASLEPVSTVRNPHRSLMIGFVLTFLYVLVTIAVFCKSVIKMTKPEVVITGKDLLFVVVINLIALVIGGTIRRKIDKV